jgi:hypothetical protein
LPSEGEQRLLPAVRDADPRERLIANGFSCQTQIEQGAGRESKHLAQIIAEALPRSREPALEANGRRSLVLTGALVAGGLLAATGLLLRSIHRRRRAGSFVPD